MSTMIISRRQVLGGLFAASAIDLTSAQANDMKIRTHRDAHCGCCGKWIQRMRAAGFEVEEIVETDMDIAKSRLGVPKKLIACHTSEIAGYIVEGHVPAIAIDRLLREKPVARGIAAPGMPAGSPGMEMAESEIYTVYLFDGDGARAFGRWRADQPI